MVKNCTIPVHWLSIIFDSFNKIARSFFVFLKIHQMENQKLVMEIFINEGLKRDQKFYFHWFYKMSIWFPQKGKLIDLQICVKLKKIQ
jgi:Tat protein secretion system quality control protein TatD with DNase activity